MKKRILAMALAVAMLCGNRFYCRAGEKDLLPAPVLFTDSTCPTVGEVRAIVVQVEFPDNTFAKSVYQGEDLREQLFGGGRPGNYPFDSITAYYERASYGNFHVTGDVYSYTAKENMEYYETQTVSIDAFAKEVVEGLDDEIDYSDYDADEDGEVDLIIFNVPQGGDEQFWYSATNYWGFGVEKCNVDGCTLYQFIVVDDQPFYYDMNYFVSVLCHEMGHTMGLPDYYLYDVDRDWEGYNGKMGDELMDEGTGDLSSFSKLMLGWLTEDQVQIYTGGKQEFVLRDASREGSCLVIPRDSMKDTDFLGEYFLVEYVSRVNNNCMMHAVGGIRIYHVEASPDRRSRQFRYENFSRFYDSTHEGIRVTRLVNDGGEFSITGDIITDGALNFAWYDRNGGQTFQVRLNIVVGENQDGAYSVCVMPSCANHKHRGLCKCGA